MPLPQLLLRRQGSPNPQTLPTLNPDHAQGEGPRCHFFSSFFANKLYKDGGYSYADVRRWTLPKRLALAGQACESILDCDLIILPVHQVMRVRGGGGGRGGAGAGAGAGAERPGRQRSRQREHVVFLPVHQVMYLWCGWEGRGPAACDLSFHPLLGCPCRRWLCVALDLQQQRLVYCHSLPKP